NAVFRGRKGDNRPQYGVQNGKKCSYKRNHPYADCCVFIFSIYNRCYSGNRCSATYSRSHSSEERNGRIGCHFFRKPYHESYRKANDECITEQTSEPFIHTRLHI